MNMRNLMIVASAAAPVFVTGTLNLMNDAHIRFASWLGCGVVAEKIVIL